MEEVSVMQLQPPPSTQRIAALDALRAVAVLAMVMGHTLDATLSDAARALPAMRYYWNFRTVTAPLFLAVAGWAVSASILRGGLQGRAVLARYLPRVVLLFACGLFLRWPGWNLPGLFTFDPQVWDHFSASDALQAVASSLLIAVLLYASLRDRRARLCAVVAVALALPLLAPLVVPSWRASLPLPLRQFLVGSATSNFPLLPWAAYFFWGILLRELLTLLPRARPALVTLGAGLLLTLLLSWISTRTGYGNRQVFFWRLALMLLVAALVLALPDALARRMAPLGRASLWAYVLHLPIAYGWSTVPGLAWWVGRSLSAPEGLALALGVVAVTVPASLWAKAHVSPRKKRLWDWVLSRLKRAQVPASPLFNPDADARSRP